MAEAIAAREGDRVGDGEDEGDDYMICKHILVLCEKMTWRFEGSAFPFPCEFESNKEKKLVLFNPTIVPSLDAPCRREPSLLFPTHRCI